MPRRALAWLISKLPARKREIDLADFWRERAINYGKRSVLNLAHGEDEFDAVTDRQKRILFPLIEKELHGTERSVLDFGCGPGRFTMDLANIAGGSAVGADITSELLGMAPRSANVSYLQIGSGGLPFSDESFDVVWSCLVLGGIPNNCIEKTIAEIERVLRPDGLFFFIENTSDLKNASHWFFRDNEAYIDLASFCNPRLVSCYEDMGEKISIFAGRKR